MLVVAAARKGHQKPGTTVVQRYDIESGKEKSMPATEKSLS